ncbi:MAG: rod shape-determining protein MreD [Alphaproteobacteria bacterium]
MIKRLNREQLEKIWFVLMPVLAFSFFILFALAPIRFPYYGILSIDLTKLALFYWSIYRPDLISPYLVFGVGIMDDVFDGEALGISAVICLFLYWVTISKRKLLADLSFFKIWRLSFVVVFICFFVEWIFRLILSGKMIRFEWNFIIQLFFIGILFPLVALILQRFQRSVRVFY